MRLKVLCDELVYAQRSYRKGDEFDVPDVDLQHANLLNTIGKTEPVQEKRSAAPAPAPASPPSMAFTPPAETQDEAPKPPRRYRRRDVVAED